MASNCLIVAAIDFGTSYSGYAYSTKSDFDRDPLSICYNQIWNAGSKRLCSLKTPTCLLLDHEMNFVAFGYEAEDKFAELASNNLHNDYYYFEHFKMQLHDKPDLSADLIITDINNKPLNAITVFALSIEALKDNLLQQIKTQGARIREKEIYWVITVPAIWTDKAKNFMRKCAEEAGIDSKRLLIALEPEAASIYYQYYLAHREKQEITDIVSKYVIVDLGGGTVDVTVHEREENGNLKELCRTTGGDCGGESVNKAYLKMWEDILSLDNPIKNVLAKHDMEYYLDLVRDFEVVKRTVKADSDKQVNIFVPYSVLDELCESKYGVGLDTMLQESTYSEDIQFKHSKMKCNPKVITDLFKKTLTDVNEILTKLYERLEMENVHHIVLVGGFSQCQYVKSEIEKKFPERSVTVPKDSGLAVLQGAVLFGHHPEIIAVRVTQYTYGISVDGLFDPDKHDVTHVKYVAGEKRCKNTFDSIMEKNKQIKGVECIQRRYNSFKNQTRVHIQVYYTSNDNPMYTDESGCYFLGEAVINIPPPHDIQHSLDVEVVFGKTEIQVKVTEMSGKYCDASFKMV